MRFPTVFINHGGGPLPLLGRQDALVGNMKKVVEDFLPKEDPTAIVVLSAHWESDPVKITSAAQPNMYFDYYGFPPETYEYQYPAPGSPALSQRIQNLLSSNNIDSRFDQSRGYDHGVFVPLMIMFPKANIPVVSVSLHASLDADVNMRIGRALSPLRDEGILILGSGYSFHNMQAFFNPNEESVQGSKAFNEWLKGTLLGQKPDYLEELKKWDEAPGARISHPREEHLMPLLMAAAAAGCEARPELIYDTTAEAFYSPLNQAADHAVTGYLFR